MVIFYKEYLNKPFHKILKMRESIYRPSEKAARNTNKMKQIIWNESENIQRFKGVDNGWWKNRDKVECKTEGKLRGKIEIAKALKHEWCLY